METLTIQLNRMTSTVRNHKVLQFNNMSSSVVNHKARWECTAGLQAERSLESLYAELVSNSIIRPCPATSLDDFFGSENFLGGVLAAQGLIPDAAVAQVRRVLTQYCIYPLGSAAVHLKSVLLCMVS